MTSVSISGTLLRLKYYLIFQLFSASDNSIVAAGLHESRINKLVFTSVGDMDSSSSVEDDANGHHRVAVITEDKKLSIFDFKGNQVDRSFNTQVPFYLLLYLVIQNYFSG